MRILNLRMSAQGLPTSLDDLTAGYLYLHVAIMYGEPNVSPLGSRSPNEGRTYPSLVRLRWSANDYWKPISRYLAVAMSKISVRYIEHIMA